MRFYYIEIIENILIFGNGPLFAIGYGDGRRTQWILFFWKVLFKLEEKMLAILSQSLLVAATMFGIVVLWQIITSLWA